MVKQFGIQYNRLLLSVANKNRMVEDERKVLPSGVHKQKTMTWDETKVKK